MAGGRGGIVSTCPPAGGGGDLALVRVAAALGAGRPAEGEDATAVVLMGRQQASLLGVVLLDPPELFLHPVVRQAGLHRLELIRPTFPLVLAVPAGDDEHDRRRAEHPGEDEAERRRLDLASQDGHEQDCSDQEGEDLRALELLLELRLVHCRILLSPVWGKVTRGLMQRYPPGYLGHSPEWTEPFCTSMSEQAVSQLVVTQ